MRAPCIAGAAVLTLDPRPRGREAREGVLGEDALDLGAEDDRDCEQAEDHGQGDKHSSNVNNHIMIAVLVLG